MKNQSLLRKWYEFNRCDNCGKISPKLFPKGILTVCCSTYDVNNKELAFYNTVDKKGNKVYSMGKAEIVKVRFPFQIEYRGFFRRMK